MGWWAVEPRATQELIGWSGLQLRASEGRAIRGLETARRGSFIWSSWISNEGDTYDSCLEAITWHIDFARG